MKKNISAILGILTMLAVILLVIILIKQLMLENKTENDTFTQKDLENMEYVDKEIERLKSTTNYKEASMEDKVIEMEKILKVLKNEKKISYYEYLPDGNMFSFKYKSGVLGGVMIKEFDTMFN